ncbi:hypothetical protein Patl1_23452 [Pistacia atlantica]|uniref:Uncharacterized protein n=1 Tax=Pistacia atlantica TaxID=434234 RepID=A0ACC0ZVX5_9ROSI|nr:hypothetical protein Patl1_23452 [Pistacia atlantica]
MAEIVATVAGVVSAVIDVGKCFGRPFMYLYSYKTNFSKLQKDVGRLKDARDEVKLKVDAAENNVEKIKQSVKDWQKEADSIIDEAGKLIGEKANNKCFNLITCYKNSRKASKKAKVLTELLQEKETLGDVVDQKSKLNSLPNDVCKECRGLPIVITTIARALRNKRHRADWDDALRELRKPSPLNFTGLLEEEYSKIALSYYYLKGPEWSRYNRPYIRGDHGRSMRIDSFMLNERETLRTLRLKLNSFIWTDELQRFKNVEFLCLDRLNGIKDDLYELDKEGFSQLKHLHVHNNPNLLHIVDSTKCIISADSFPAFPILESLILFNLMKLEKICYGEPTTKSFYNLKFIEVKSCAKLENIFSFSNASRSLPKLQRIKVKDCQNMKEIFAVEREYNVNNNEEIDHEIKFSQLRFLTLDSLKSLASFYSGLKTPPTLQTRQKELTINLRSNNTLMPLFSEKVCLTITMCSCIMFYIFS